MQVQPGEELARPRFRLGTIGHNREAKAESRGYDQCLGPLEQALGAVGLDRDSTATQLRQRLLVALEPSGLPLLVLVRRMRRAA